MSHGLYTYRKEAVGMYLFVDYGAGPTSLKYRGSCPARQMIPSVLKHHYHISIPFHV